jgi:hypothetical protein
MTSETTRRTLGGLAPKAGKPAGIDRLIKAKRTPAPGLQAQQGADAKSAPVESSVHQPDEQTQEVTESVTHRVPKYLQLRRREARIFDEQADSLTMLARQLNNQRKRPDGKTVGERITDNTLIRVAIDLLLERKDEIHGTTEQEIAASLGLQPRQLR